MRLAVFFPASLFSAWACSYGLVNTLKRMGHEVTSVPIDPQKPYALQVPEEGEFEAAIISGPEHLQRLHKVKWGVPSVAWLHETVEREDYGKLDVDAIKRSADVVFCPGIQDEKYGFKYLPFGVDTEIFHPHTPETTKELFCSSCSTFVSLLPPKLHDAAFIGLLYPKRQAFLAELKKHGVNLTTGNVQVLELGGINPRKTAELYAENIRKIKVFVNLPTLSQLAVTKIYEVLACGTPILTPEISEMANLERIAAGNGSGRALFTYRTAAEVADFLRSDSPILDTLSARTYASENPDRLELRCQVLIDALKTLGAKAA